MKRKIAALTALATGLLVTSVATSAGATPPPANALHVTVNAEGTAATLSTHQVHKGYLTLTADDTSGASLTVVDVHRGHTIKQLLHAINLQTGDNPSPADAARSTRIINQIASAFSGADIQNANQFVSTTIFLPKAGDYYVVGVGDKARNFGEIHADHHGNGVQPASDETLLVGNGDSDTFAPAGLTIPKSGTLRVQNNGDSIHLFEMSKVKTGTTDAQVQAEFDAILAGQQPTSDPAGFNSPPKDSIGTDAMTPGNAAYLKYANLPHGDYLALCFIADDTTGIPHAFMGMHLIIHVR